MPSTEINRGVPAALRNPHEVFPAGRSGFLADDIQDLTGVAPRTFRQRCERHAAAFG
ncbi:hypothetical protein [Actinoplanes sp. N902-109]|uniref:hypothetical protein n=1 Tax=Actinoplanes sp. (strain N902-109) TaxID=649831 RepID=UPI0003294CDF|nr:hypothetical protein [Actinoplanes sp. N902-109]AGL19311.1 hypothetical protein L083_5801 [Actinoplanes sp. N902-109]